MGGIKLKRQHVKKSGKKTAFCRAGSHDLCEQHKDRVCACKCHRQTAEAIARLNAVSLDRCTFCGDIAVHHFAPDFHTCDEQACIEQARKGEFERWK